MNKIKKYLISLGIEIKKIKSCTSLHRGNSSWYYKTYDVDVYEVMGTEYRIHYKRTGRLEYRLYKGYALVAARSSQVEFCKLLQELFL